MWNMFPKNEKEEDMNQYRTCEICGASLDPGEICDCVKDGLPAISCAQPPVIIENLENIKQGLQLLMVDISELPRNDESLKYVKQVRANLSKELDKMETQRKAAKKKALEPYERAETKYREYISGPYKDADAKLKAWVDDYQNELKQKCEAVLKDYFTELCQAYGIDFIPYEILGLSVDMATARQKEPRKAMDAIKNFLSDIRDDMDMILKMENAAEIMAEYRKTPILSKAMAAIAQRQEEQETMQTYVAEQKQRMQQVEEHKAAILAAAPEVVVEQEERFTVSFCATGSIAALKAMKAYGASLGIVFEENKEETNDE